MLFLPDELVKWRHFDEHCSGCFVVSNYLCSYAFVRGTGVCKKLKSTTKYLVGILDQEGVHRADWCLRH